MFVSEMISAAVGCAQNFREVLDTADDEADGEVGRTTVRLYANVALGATTHPCRVHQDFQCILHVREKDLAQLPPALLSRFSKYRLQVTEVAQRVMSCHVADPKATLHLYERCQDFLQHFKPQFLCGAGTDDGESLLASLFLSLLRPSEADGPMVLHHGLPKETFEYLENTSLLPVDCSDQDRHKVLLIRAVQVHLLQLCTPEHLLLRLAIFPDYALMARIYFQVTGAVCNVMRGTSSETQANTISVRVSGPRAHEPAALRRACQRSTGRKGEPEAHPVYAVKPRGLSSQVPTGLH